MVNYFNVLRFILVSTVLSIFAFASTNAQSLELVGTCDLTGNPKCIVVEGNYALIGGYEPLLQIVNISNPENPILVSSYDTTTNAWNLCIAKGHVFIADAVNGLIIVDVSNPANPDLVSIYDNTYFNHGIVVRNNIAYLVSCMRLQILDISNLSAPTLISEITLYMGDARQLFVKGNYAFVVGYHNPNFKILNIEDASNPVIVYSNDDFPYGDDIFILHDYAYISTLDGLQIVNIADPMNPIFSAFDSTRSWRRVHCEDNYVFLSDWSDGICMLDISNPTNPELLYHDDLFGYRDLFSRDGLLYAIRGQGFLDIFRFEVTANYHDVNNIPMRLQSFSSFPNPFNSSTTINYSLTESKTVILSIYNIKGQQISELYSGTVEAGNHSITWNASDYPSGIYFARFETQGFTETQKMLLLK